MRASYAPETTSAVTSKEPRRRRPSARRSTTPRWLTPAQLKLILPFTLAAITLIGVLVYAFTRGSSGVDVSVPGIHLKLSPPSNVVVTRKQLTTFDGNAYFREDVLGLAFLKPKSPPWSAPVPIHGFAAFMRAQAFRIEGQTADSLLKQVPPLFRRFIGRMEAIRVTSGRPLPVRTTAETTVDELGVPQPAGGVTIDLSNAFAVEAYDKSLLGKFKLTLASFATISLSAVEATLDKLVTNGKTITGIATIRIHKAHVAGKVSDLTLSRDFLFAEGKRYFYEVEIAYSPQTHDSTARWSDLQQMLQSFRVDG